MRASVVAAAARPLMEHFERLSEAPGAVGEFRRLILDLAVRGKLVEQDERDEPAGVLLKRISHSRKGRQQTPSVKTEELTLPAIPVSWVWTTVDHLAADEANAITDGPFGANLKTEHYITTPGFRVIRLQNIGHGVFRNENRSYIEQSRFEHLAKHQVFPGDLVVAGLVDPSVRSCEVPENIGPAIVKADCYRFAVHPKMSSRYVLYYLNSPTAQDFTASHNHGMTLVRIGLGNFRRTPVPLPPLAEQKRIVAKVDQLMALCDRLEAAQSVREYTRDRLAKATLQKLNTESESKSPNPPSFRNHAQFFIHHLPRMSTRPEHIAGLRQSILNLAVRGKLVEQDARDEPAGVLLKRIAAEKARLVREEIGTHSNPESFSRAPPFDIPTTWRWVCVGEVADSRLGKMLDQAKNKGNYRRYLRNVNVRWYNFDLSDILEMRFEDSELEEFRLRRGDVLICEGGEPGRAAVWDERETDIYFQKAIHRVRLSNTVDSYFFVHVLKLSAASDWLAGYFTGTGIKHLTGRGLASFRFPLPPLAEQKRIVAKVDQLMTLCDQLEQQISTTQTKNHALLKAILQKINTPTP